MAEVILLEKTANEWYYLHNEVLYEAGVIEGTLYEQLFLLVSYILEDTPFDDSEYIICSNAFVQNVLPHIANTFPRVRFVTINTPDILRAFQRAFRDARAERNSRNASRGETLYVCSDASYSQLAGLSGWAWVSQLPGEEGYNFGVSNQSSTVLVELEGILRAITENRKLDYSKLHVYCDSQQSVAIANMIMGDQKKWNLDLMKTLQKRSRVMAEVAHETAQAKDVEVTWVRGHANHRLNIGADFLSREVWKSAQRGERLRHSDPRVKASLELIRR